MRTGLVSLLFLVASILAVMALYRDYQSVLAEPLYFDPEEQIYVIHPGSSLSTVLTELQDRRIIQSPAYLYYAASRRGMTHRIQAGEYRLRAGTRPLDLLEQFVRGEVVQYSLTLVEGWRLRDVMRAVRGHPALQQVLPDDRPETIRSALQISSTRDEAEGIFLAETWHFTRGSSELSVLRRARRALQDHLQEQWASRSPGLPYHSAEEALVMASLIEKETALVSERARIAGVFVRRLQRGMKLQSDPTVIFAMGERYDGNIRKSDLAVDSPYNTYLHKGLPPGPIALVGAAAIRAALHPEGQDALYFVSRGDGSHQFSATLAEHNRAVRKYQLRR